MRFLHVRVRLHVNAVSHAGCVRLDRTGDIHWNDTNDMETCNTQYSSTVYIGIAMVYPH